MLTVPNHTAKYEFGVLVSFAYKLRDPEPDGLQEIIVATTRIETMLGDTAVAVNSKDPRYQKLIGKELVHPFIPGRKMKVITDDVLVDMSFGTGCVKITPAHDFNDYECGMRHKLEFVNIFTEDGKINENGGAYAVYRINNTMNLFNFLLGYDEVRLQKQDSKGSRGKEALPRQGTQRHAFGVLFKKWGCH